MSKKPAKKSTARKSTRKPARKAKKSTTAVKHRSGTIREKLEVLYKKHGYAEAKVAAAKAGINKFTATKQLYLIHVGQ